MCFIFPLGSFVHQCSDTQTAQMGAATSLYSRLRKSLKVDLIAQTRMLKGDGLVSSFLPYQCLPAGHCFTDT